MDLIRLSREKLIRDHKKCTDILKDVSEANYHGKSLLVGKKRPRLNLDNTAEDELAVVEARKEAFKKLKQINQRHFQDLVQ